MGVAPQREDRPDPMNRHELSAAGFLSMKKSVLATALGSPVLGPTRSWPRRRFFKILCQHRFCMNQR